MKISAFSLSTALFVCLPVATVACVDPIVAIGEDGMARYIVDAEVRDASMRFVKPKIGTPPEGRPILFVDVRVNQASWISSDQLMTAHSVYDASGDGFLYTGPDECTPRNVPIELPVGKGPASIDLPTGRAPVELFPNEPTVMGLEPLSGLWQATAGPVTSTGCPSMIASNLAAASPSLPAEALRPRRLTFQSPFHPEQLEMTEVFQRGMQSELGWQSAGPASWRTEVVPKIFAQISSDYGSGSSMIWTLTVRSQTEIAHAVDIRIVLPAAARAVMGSRGDCRVSSVNAWRRIGD